MTDFEEDYPGQLLHQAAFYDNVELLQELLASSERSHINAANSSGQTALHSAVAGDSRESLQMLLQAGADPGIASGMRDNCRTPLHQAVGHSKVECVKVLVDGGASLEVKDGEGKTAYHLATALGNRKILDILQMEKEAQRKIKEIITADLYQACVDGRPDKAAELISQLDKEVINAAYNGGSTLLYRASQLGHESVVQLLLDSGADTVPNVGTGLTPLHAACWTGQVNIATLLLQHLPQFAGMDSSQSLQLPIHVAASQGHLGIVNVLLNMLDPIGVDSRSNLNSAAFDINALDLNWHSSLHLAVLEGRVSVVEALLQWSARTNTSSITEGNPASPRSPLEDLGQRITVDTYSVLGRTPLHDAVKSGELAITALLLQHGANPDLPAKLPTGSSPYNSLDSNGSFEGTSANMTALAEAASCGNKDIVVTLLKYGAKDMRDVALQSALTNGHTDIAGLLLSCSGVAIDLESKLNRRLQLFLERSCSVEEDNLKSIDSVATVMSSDGTMASGNLGTAVGTLARTSTRNKAVRVNWCWRNLRRLNIEWFIEACIHLNHSLMPSKSALVCITKIDVSDNQIVQLPKEIFVDMDSLQQLNSCNNCISNLPEFKDDDSFNSPSLREVDISGNRLSGIPTWIFQLPALEVLNLSNNRLKTLPFGIWTAQKLTHLDISVNLLDELPSRPDPESECVVQATDKEEDRVRTETNSSKESNESFHTPNGSDEENEPDASADVKEEASPLQRRESSNSVVQPWRPTNSNCKRRKLDRINIWEKDVATSILTEEFASEADEESTSTSSLDFLNVAWNKLTAVPTGLPCLAPRLSKLDLSHNNISDMSPPNAYPKGLTKLLLPYNKIEDSKRYSRQDSESSCYSPYASSLRNSVSGASIADIKISRSESVLSQISFLSLLSLCHHRRHSILPSLKILDLSDNQIESLDLVYSLEESRPSSLSDAAEVTNLSSKSHSTGDPAHRKQRKRTSESSTSSLDQLTNLHPLYPKLSTLNISNNKIKFIPADMGLYQDLTMLYVSDNKDIRTLPMELGKLEKLWDFRANGMELEEPLQGLQLRSTRHLIGYLRSILDQSRPYCRMKLMLVGLQGVGKTSLLHEMRREGTGSYQEAAIKGWASRMGYFRNDQKTRKGQNISTVGVDVGDWTYVKKVKKRPCELGEVTFSTWDFGGQREYYATHQYFLSKRSLYLACWKITDGEKGIEDLQQWLINIQARAPDSPVIIVGTHYDEFKKYPPSFLPQLREMIDSRFINLPEPHLHGLPKVKGQLEVSCKNHHNIRELCDFIYDTVFQLKVRGGTGQLLLKQPIPATYLALQKTVAQIAAQRKAEGKHPVLVGDQYKIEVMTEMMRKENLCFRDHEELKQATQFLHENGVLLHYEDVALKNLYFLDPQWLCDMLAHVVTIPEINGYVKNGILETKCLSMIFKSASITPVDIRLYIVDLLNKFEVALTWDNKNLLIPSLLPTEETIKKLAMNSREVKITMKRKGKKSKAMVVKPNKDHVTSRPIHVSRPAKISAGKSTFYQGAASSPLPAPPKKEDVNGNSTCEERKNKLEVTCTGQFLRFYLMSYFPSGFWSRLITRVFADEHLYEMAAACFEPISGDIGDGPVQVLMESPHWVCWQTGFKLRHCTATLLSVKEVIGEEDEKKKYSTLPLSNRDVPSMAGHHGGKLQISVPLSEVRYSYTHTVSTPSSISEEEQKKIVLKTDVAVATRLLAVVVDHLDLLLQDWYTDIGERFRQTSHGLYLVRRVIPCPKCQKAAATAKQPKKKQKDVHHRGDAWEVVEVSPQDHEPYVSKTVVSPIENSKSGASEKSLQATENTNTDATIPSAAKSAKEDTKEDMLFQLELSTETQQGSDKVEDDAKNDGVAERQSTPDVVKKEEYTEPKKPLTLAFVEPAKPAKGGDSQNVSEDQPRKQRKGKMSKAEQAAITTFQFDDLVYQSLSQKTVECPRHGTLLLKNLVPDVMFEDIAAYLLMDPSEITSQRLLGTGAFGFVFQGLRKTKTAPGTSVALKILEPRDPGKEAPDTAKKEYAQHKRKWTQEPTWAACKAYCTVRQEMMVLSSLTHNHIVKEYAQHKRKWTQEPTWAACKAYCTVRQEMMVLSSLTHDHIVSLLGVCHQPLCLVLELACRGALDTRLREYRREGARLDPCVVQLIIVQISSAISYLHSHRIIYRDLKAQNVLVWSLPAPADDPSCNVHVKLADYGISRAAMPRGEVKGYGGSPGYMAPEIVQHYGMEAYTEKVDCFSFAMFLYELLSLKQPFEGLDQINDLILREKRPPLTEKERSYPTTILDVMSLCWSHDPHNRPGAAEIHKAARCPEFPLLLQAMPVADGPGKTALVACATYSEQVQVIDDGYGGVLEQCVTQVWLCNLAQNGPPTQVDILQVVDGKLKEDAMAFEVPDVVCRVCIIGDMIWMGIDKPMVHIYRLSTLEKLKTVSLSNNVRRTNTVRSILHIPDTRTVLVALSLGTVVQYKYSGGDSSTPNSGPITVTEVHRARLEYHTFSAAIVNSSNRSTELWLGGRDGGMKIVDGESLVVLKDLNHFDPKCSKVNVMHLATQGGPDRPGVGGNVWSYVYPGTIVYKWEVNTWYNTHTLDCKDCLPNLHAGSCQVTCLQVQGDQLYVGTVWGHLLICDASKMTCLAQVKGHLEDVKYIIPVSSGIQLSESLLQQGADQDSQSNKQQKSQLLTIGQGYNYLLQNHMQGSHIEQSRPSSESILLVWDADSWELAGQC